MELAVLGPVLVDGRPPRGAIERALLARLLVSPRTPVPASELIEAAWPEERRADAAASLRVRLARLRETLEPGRPPGAPPSVLVRDPGGYRLVVDPERVDAQRLVRLAEEAARLPAPGALARCDEALALWRGEPFAELDGVEVAAAEARRLHGVRAAVRRRRAAALRDVGRIDDAVVELEDLVAADPLREELVRELMLALYHAGRPVESLEAYRTLARRLSELGLRPGPAVRELETLVLRHADQLAPAALASAVPTNVGARVTSVLGREDDVAAVLAALGAHRIVTLVGPGGVGKTTVATEVARAALGRVPDGAWLVELGPLRGSDEVASATATALGLRRVGGHDDGHQDALALVRERLRAARVLLVLDGGEHLVPGLGAVVRELAAAGPDVRVLATSRRALGVPAEAVVEVAPLAVPAADAHADEVRRASAVRLFEERARAARPGWSLGDAEAAAVGRICRRLDGLPLAVELAAARLRALSADAIAERLEAGLAVLGRGTLDASIEASHALLSPPEQELYRRLSVFESTFELEDAEQVAGGDGLARDDVLELLVGLVDHSMVQAEGDTPRRYRMLEALRADARGRLDAGAARAAGRRHAAHLARLAADAANRVWADGAEAAGEPLVGRQADLEAAFGRAMAERDAGVALDLAAGLGALHHRLGTVPAGVACMQAALDLDGGSGAGRLGTLWWHGALLLAEARVADARAVQACVRELLPEHGAPGDGERLRLLDGQIALCAGELEAARATLDGLPAAFARRGERFLVASALWTQGAVALAAGDLAEAVARLRESCDHFAACGDVCSADGAAADLAQAAALAGADDEAAAACERAIGLAPERPLGERATHLLHEAALAAARGGDHARAAELVAATPTAAPRDPTAVGPWHAPAAAGDLALMAGDAGGARARYEHARAIAAEVRARSGPSLPAELYIVSSELRLAEALASAGDRDGALRHARAALAHARATPAPAAGHAALEAVRRLEGAQAAVPAP